MKKPLFMLSLYSVLLVAALTIIGFVFITAGSFDSALQENAYALLGFGFLIISNAMGFIMAYRQFKKDQNGD